MSQAPLLSADKPEHPPTTSTERTVASMIHIAGIVAPLWVPLLAWFIHRKTSRFIASHAWQEVVDGIVWKGIFLLALVFSLVRGAIFLVNQFQSNWENFSWVALGWQFGTGVAITLGLFIWNFGQALNQANKARKGYWPKRELKKQAKQGSLG